VRGVRETERRICSMHFVYMYENTTMKPIEIVLRKGGLRKNGRRGESN
jgi:hypothetical protein